MKREHKQLQKLATEQGLSKEAWVFLCILENIHGLAYAERACRDWPVGPRWSA